MSWFSTQGFVSVLILVLLSACFLADPVGPTESQLTSEWLADRNSPHTKQREALEAAQAVTRERMEVKGHLLDELIAERMTLRQVGNLFRELNAPCPQYARVLDRSIPAQTTDERMARNVLDHLQGRLLHHPHRDAILARTYDRFLSEFGYPVH